MVAGGSKLGQVNWWVGLRRYYLEEWPSTRAVCLFFIVGASAIWICIVAPFALGYAVTTGELTNVSCRSKGYAYAYVYSVQGTIYSGVSGFGGLDGNPGTCSRHRIWQPVLVTYSPTHPERSLGGTIEGRFLSGLMLVGSGIGFLVLFGVPMNYIMERRRRPVGDEEFEPSSRQYRRARDRRERKAMSQNAGAEVPPPKRARSRK